MPRAKDENQYKQKSASETKEAMSYYKICKMQRVPTIHIPNEGKRSKAGGGIMKAMGMTSGTLDFFHMTMRGGYGGLWIEIKRNKKYTPSELKSKSWLAQIQMIKLLRCQGYMAQFCFGWEHAKKIRDYYLNLPVSSPVKVTILDKEIPHVLNSDIGNLFI